MRSQVPCGVPVLEHGVTHWYFRRQTRFYTFSWPLSCWLSDHIADYDLVHIHALFSYSTLAAAYWARRYRVPYVVRPLGTLNHWGMQKRRPTLKRLSFRLIETHILHHAAAIHYTSEQERIEASELSIAGRSEVIPNAIDNRPDTGTAGRFRAQYPQLKGRQIVLFLSRFDKKKGLDLLLPAFAAVRAEKPEAILVLAGGGEPAFVAHLKRECVRLGLGSDVLWPGFLNGAEKQAAIADADVFVLPSYSENFGIAAVEAMDAGVPVIISDQVAIHNEVASAAAGLVIPCQVGPLSEAILRLLSDVRERSVLGRNGRSLVQDRYSLTAVTKRLIHVYEDVLAEAESKRKPTLPVLLQTDVPRHSRHTHL